MIQLNRFIAENISRRVLSLFEDDIQAKAKFLAQEIEGPSISFVSVRIRRRVNIMGASKWIMEDLVMAYNDKFKVTTARFANVAFSNGSLPDGWLHRLQK